METVHYSIEGALIERDHWRDTAVLGLDTLGATRKLRAAPGSVSFSM
jgi:hypothetical protein